MKKKFVCVFQEEKKKGKITQIFIEKKLGEIDGIFEEIEKMYYFYKQIL